MSIWIASLLAAVTRDSARYRWQVASRVAAAFGGGYALAALATAVLSLLLPLFASFSRAEAVLTATLWSFMLYATFVLWAFSVRNVRRVWLVVALIAVALATILFVLQGGGL